MTLSKSYFNYLKHFNRTVPVRVLASSEAERGLIALRHDVDHSLDAALEMAYWEWHQGFAATYFLLPTAPYWNADKFELKVLQLQDYGHEIGLHFNGVAQWLAGKVDDVSEALASQLSVLRGCGVEVVGVAAHGDRLCYDLGGSNYWCFRELRPTDPVAAEDGRTAEGPYDPSGARAIAYPPNHRLVRADGSELPLWSISMADHGLEYHAWHVPKEKYYSDSGGRWSRTSDPLGETFSGTRVQVLMHPEHWRGEAQVYFFLATARSGSKWLAEVLDRATPLETRHEYVLNQPFFHGKEAQKRTGPGFAEFAENPEAARPLLLDAWNEISQLGRDYAEVNVYLPHFVRLLRGIFPEACLVHLTRDPKDVVRSLLDRDWYGHPEDTAHPSIPVGNWNRIGQFGRICSYVAYVGWTLFTKCNFRLRSERMVQDLDYLADALGQLGIPLHRRLAEAYIGKVINASRQRSAAPWPEWNSQQRATYERICGRVARHLGYEVPWRPTSKLLRWQDDVWYQTVLLFSTLAGEISYWYRLRMDDRLLISEIPDPCGWGGTGFTAEWSVSGQTAVVHVAKTNRHAHLCFGGKTMRNAGDNGSRAGWPVLPGHALNGRVSVELEQGRLTVFLLGFGKDGRLEVRNNAGVVTANQPTRTLAFRLPQGVHTIDIALYASASDAPECFTVREFMLQSHPQRDPVR